MKCRSEFIKSHDKANRNESRNSKKVMREYKFNQSSLENADCWALLHETSICWHSREDFQEGSGASPYCHVSGLWTSFDKKGPLCLYFVSLCLWFWILALTFLFYSVSYSSLCWTLILIHYIYSFITFLPLCDVTHYALMFYYLKMP